MASWLDMFRPGDPPGTKTAKVMERLGELPWEQRTTASVYRLMREEGVQRPLEMYEGLAKAGLLPKESDLVKNKEKDLAKVEEVTDQLLPLLTANLPDVASSIETMPKEPLGRIKMGAASEPLTPRGLQALVPGLKAPTLPGAPPVGVGDLPPAALFGEEAAPLLEGIPQPPGEAQALPQMVVPGQTLPTEVVAAAAKGAGPAEKAARFGVDREAKASELFKPKYGDRVTYGVLTAEEQKQVNDALKKDEIEARRAQGSERAIDPKDQANIVDRATLQPPKEKVQTYADFNARQDLIYVEPKYREAHNQWGKSAAIVASLDQLSKGLNTETDWAKANLRGGQAVIGARTGANESARTYLSQVEAWANLLAKHVTQQAGVLTERDTDRMKAAFPKLWDTKAVRDAKIEAFAEIMQLETEAILANARGEFSTSKYADRIEELADRLDWAEMVSKQERLRYLKAKGEEAP